jgi:hypothetical protein
MSAEASDSDKERSYSPTPLEFGGTLAGTPLPPEPFYPLRCDQFLTLRDGELSEARSIRDSCLSAFAAAAVGIGGLVAVINWDASIKQQKVALAATAVLCIGAVATLIVAWVQRRHIKRTRTKSTYARLINTIAGHFEITGEVAVSDSPLRSFFRRFKRG